MMGPADRTIGLERGRDVWLVLAIALASRAWVLLIAAATQFGPALDGRFGNRALWSLFVRWDANWYLGIIEQGYRIPDDPAGRMPHPFFPMYPLLVRGIVSATSANPAIAGIVLSTALFCAAAYVVFLYARDLRASRDVALAAVVLLAFAPESVVFSSIYAESTFLLLLAGAMLALRRERYFVAGLLAALLSATRPNGVLYMVYVLAWHVQRFGWRALARPWRDPGTLLTLTMAPLGLIAYWWFCFFTTGDAFAHKSAVTHGWKSAFDWPWQNLAHHLRATSTDRFWAYGSLVYFVASLALLRFRMRAEFAFCLASFLLVWTINQPPSLIRYAMVLFPIYIAVARLTEGRPVLLAAIAASLATINAFLTVAFVLGWRIAV